MGGVRALLCLASEGFTAFPGDEFIKTAGGLAEIPADSLW